MHVSDQHQHFKTTDKTGVTSNSNLLQKYLALLYIIIVVFSNEERWLDK